ncbi:Nn.00g096650.m01.CDS01 [Neocucurbitaria sp. VM-36]
MSGIEIAGLALGAIPVILEAIKGYRDAYEQIQTFKHATKQLHLIDAQFRVCRLNFLSECRLLLELVLSSPELSKEMLADPSHNNWQDSTMEQQLARLLQENVDVCTTIVKDTHSTINDFIARLSRLQPTSKATGGLRTQLTPLESQSRTAILVSPDARTIVDHLSRVRFASGLLHDTLKSTWSCLDQSHLRHWAKMCMVSEPDVSSESVTLDMAISCDIVPPLQLPSNENATIWLYVRSESIQSQVSTGQPTIQKPLQSLVDSLQPPPPPLRPNSSAQAQTFSAPIPIAGVSSGSNSPQASDGIDICKVVCVCSHFQQNVQTTCGQYVPQCLGYLNTKSNARYLFYPPSIPKTVSATSPNPTGEVTTLISLIERAQRGPSELLYQYQLALRISMGVLQFHNTAWLPPTWKLQDVSVFGSQLSPATLKTLHLSTRFESMPQAQRAVAGAPSTPTSNIDTLTPVDACCKRICPGIYNETLFSLGIALLEIAHWQSFTTLSQDDPDDFYAAHRLVRGPPPLGPKYRKIVERCLRCDFGAGNENLEDSDLQHAVWSKVVYPLEALIRDTSSEV